MLADKDKLQDAIGKILNNFNYTKVVVVMNVLGWHWWGKNRSPNETEIRDQLRSLLYSAYDLACRTPASRKGEWCYASTGGLLVWCFVDENGPVFQASFAVESASNSYNHN